jgi:uncharacterized protein (TIGR01244 family)
MKNETQIDGIIVAGQPTDEELAGLAERGIRTLINVRPADELDEPEAPKVPSGIAYSEVPFTGLTLRAEHVRRIREALDAGDGPAVIHCAAGTRAAVVAAIVASERAGEDARGALERLAKAGFEADGSPYRGFIERYFF